MMTTTGVQNKRSEELSETEIEELLNDVWAKLPLEAKRSIMSVLIERAALVASERASYLKKQIESDSQNGLDTYTGPLTLEHIKKAKEVMDLNETQTKPI